MLIEAFALLHAEFPHWRLQIWGEGRDRACLEKKIAGLGLTERIFLRGQHDDIEQAYKEGLIFCHPSRFEGFPNAVIEAMRHSLPVVGLSACSALREIVSPDQGILALESTADSLAAALRPLLATRLCDGTRAGGPAAPPAAICPRQCIVNGRNCSVRRRPPRGAPACRFRSARWQRVRLRRRLETSSRS